MYATPLQVPPLPFVWLYAADLIIWLCFDMQQPSQYGCGCGVLISNVGKAEREHCKSERHHKWLKIQQSTKTLSASFVKKGNPVASSSSSSNSSSSSGSNPSTTTTAHPQPAQPARQAATQVPSPDTTTTTAQPAQPAGQAASGTMYFGSHGSITLGVGLGSHSTPGEHLNHPP